MNGINEIEQAKKYLYDAIYMILQRKPVRDLDERMARLDSLIADIEKPAVDIPYAQEAQDAADEIDDECVEDNNEDFGHSFRLEKAAQIVQKAAEEYHEQCTKKAQEIIESGPRRMIASGISGPMSLNAQLKRCEAYHAKECAKCKTGGSE